MLCDVVSWVENGLVFKHRNKKASFFELQVMFVEECTEVGTLLRCNQFLQQPACVRPRSHQFALCISIYVPSLSIPVSPSPISYSPLTKTSPDPSDAATAPAAHSDH
jgi:hypothetical protein